MKPPVVTDVLQRSSSMEDTTLSGACISSFIHRAWTTGSLPQQWKDSDIVTIYKRKSDRQVCGNSHVISLLSVAVKVLADVILKRLLTHVVDIVVPESQCGFRCGCSTVDMMFVARLLQEKYREQNHDLAGK